MRKAECDFLAWTSFPSSLKLVSDEPTAPWLGLWLPSPSGVAVRPGSKLVLGVSVKQEKGISPGEGRAIGYIPVMGFDGSTWSKRILYIGPFPQGSFDWTAYKGETIVPADIKAIRIAIAGAGTTNPSEPASSWFDDLKVYQDDQLIYSNDFSNWDPFIGAGVGAPIGGVAGYLLKEPLGPMVSEAVGAVLGGVLGGGIGLLTGLGIIPVPQIPSLEAAPEGPEAPARLGKYQITG